VLDVKFGTGAFMRTKTDAEALAQALTSVGLEMGVQTSHVLTPMDEPLGQTVGNALEVAESVATLQGKGPRDLVELTLTLCAAVSNSPREQLARWLEDGTAWRKFVAMVEAQGGDSTALERITEVHAAPIIRDFTAKKDGRLAWLDAGAIGRASVALGAGRAKSTDRVDFAVGFDAIRKTEERLQVGESLFRIHARDEASFACAMEILEGAVEIAPN
jgi:thymidine phosphorylase